MSSPAEPVDLSDDIVARVHHAIETAMPGRAVLSLDDLGGGRGVFGAVIRATFTSGLPASVAVKLAIIGPDGDAARRSGAYEREALAYRHLLPHLDVRSPNCYGLVPDALGPTIILEDLSDKRSVDQLDGLQIDDALAVATQLGTLHRAQAERLAPVSSPVATVRGNVVGLLDPPSLRSGLRALDRRWSEVIGPDVRRAFTKLVDGQAELADRLAATGPTVLCHGDPRADNLVFDSDGSMILFDWQQIAHQPGVADLAWMAATSLASDARRLADDDLVRLYGEFTGNPVGIDAYRAGFALPGLAVLLLAQRQATNDRTRAFITTSLQRVGQALVDLDVVKLVEP